MENLTALDRFLHSMDYREADLRKADLRNGQNPYITISREAGAGGHALAEQLARDMARVKHLPLFQGWASFDEGIAKKLAENPKLKVSLDSLQSEEFCSELEDFLRQILSGNNPQSEVIRETFKLVRTLAARGKVVIVGRGGSLVTQGLSGGIHIRLVASKKNRVKNLMRLFNVDEPSALKKLEEQDAARQNLVRKYFNRSIDDPLLYDMVWNTDSVPMEVISATTLRMVEYRVKNIEAKRS